MHTAPWRRAMMTCWDIGAAAGLVAERVLVFHPVGNSTNRVSCTRWGTVKSQNACLTNHTPAYGGYGHGLLRTWGVPCKHSKFALGAEVAALPYVVPVPLLCPLAGLVGQSPTARNGPCSP